MSSAGQQLVAGRIPAERIATTVETSDSTAFTTTETVVMSVTAPVVVGRTYRVRAVFRWQSTVSGDTVNTRIRQNNVAGATLQQAVFELPGITGSLIGPMPDFEVEFPATATEDQTFVLTAARFSGSGTINRDAGPSAPNYMYVDYIRG